MTVSERNGKHFSKTCEKMPKNEKKGEIDAEDYFTLENSGEPKVLTAISESSLEIKGMR